MKKILLGLMILMLCGCSVLGEVDEEQITNYLNKKYGDDIKFTSLYKSSCKVYELGRCRATFTSDDLEDKEIQIFWNEDDGSDMKDDYLYKKYESELVSYYTKLFKGSINGNFELKLLANKSDYNWKKMLTFDEFLKYDNLNLAISINVVNEDIDINVLVEQLKNVLKNNNISNVASLYLANYKSGCNLNDIKSCKKVNSIYNEVKIVEFFDENSKKY